MKRQYFFKSYKWKNNGELNSLKYCPACGTKCVAKEESLRIRPVCPGCGFVHYRNPYPGVVVLIEQEGKVLLGKRSSGSFQAGKWCLPVFLKVLRNRVMILMSLDGFSFPANSRIWLFRQIHI